jgi:DNA-binding NarL/FixJ family response regulator
VPWAERARRELEATARRRTGAGDPDALTQRERQVAIMMADGATVREAANRLFITAKTVEAHLSRVYRKLGVHNRAQLVRALTARQP